MARVKPGCIVASHDFDEVDDHEVGSFWSKLKHTVSSAAHAVTHAAGGAIHGVTHAVASGGRLLGHVPIVGSGLRGAFNLTVGAPFAVAEKVVSGQRLDKVALSSLKEGVANVRAVAPYAQTVISFVPGIGQGVAGAIGASLALASGMPITQAVLEGVKGALPGGALAKAAFDVGEAAIQGRPIDQIALAALPLTPQQKDIVTRGLATAKALAHGQRVDQALLNQAMTLLPETARKAVQIGMALGHGQVLQAMRGAASATPAARDVFGKLENALPAPMRRLPLRLHSADLSRAHAMIARNPVLSHLPITTLARRANVSTSTIQTALNRQRGLNWRPLSPMAMAWVRKLHVYAPAHALGDTRGLSPDGLVYVVESGDYPGKIALKLTGSANRWPELIAANKQKPTVNRGIGPEFKTLFAGEKLTVPSSWKVAAPAVPAIVVPTTTPSSLPSPSPVIPPVAPTTPVLDPARETTATVLQAKALLVAWTKTDGAKEAGFPDYGLKAEDLSTTFGPRDEFILASFEGWSNRTRGTQLPVDGILTDAAAAALRDWADKSAAPVIPPLAPAEEPTPSASPTPSTSTSPTPQIDLPEMTIPASAPTAPAPSSATAAKPAGGLALALVGAGSGALLAGLPGAAMGGVAGFVLDQLLAPKQSASA
jgi:hypothetical protein